MIRIFNNNQFITRFHKKNGKYGDYIIAVRQDFDAIKRINRSIEEEYTTHTKLTESLYEMPEWHGTPQGRYFWEDYLDYVDEIYMDLTDNIWE